MIGLILSAAIMGGLAFASFKLVGAIEKRTMAMPVFLKLLIWFQAYMAMGKTANMVLAPINQYLKTIA